MRGKHEINMTEGPLWGKIAAFTVPLMITGFLQLLYNAADNVVVGRYAVDKEASLAAVGSTGALINLIVNLFIGLSVGTSVVVAQYKGAQKDREVHETVHTSVTISVIFGFILMIIGLTLAKPLLQLMDSPDDVIDLAALYMRIYFVGMPVNMLYNFGSAVMRAVGDTKRPMFILIVSGLINVVLNLLFVIAFHMDVAGVALATIISQAVSAVAVVICLMHNDDCTRLELKKLGVNMKRVKELAESGMPAGLQGMLFSISNVLIQSSVNSFKSTFMAGNAAAGNLEGFVYTMMNTLYQASLTFCGQNVGAKKYRRVGKITMICAVYVTVLGLVMGVGVYKNGHALISIYNENEDVIKAGLIRLRYVCQPYFFCGLMDMLVGSLRGMGKSVMPMIVSLLGACVLRVVWIYTIFRFDPRPEVLYISYPISWIVTAAVHFVCFLVVYKKLLAKGMAEGALME